MDSIIPTNRDCTSHTIKTHMTGQKTKTYSVTFHYNDGSIRTFDGRVWKLVSPSFAEEDRMRAELNRKSKIFLGDEEYI